MTPHSPSLPARVSMGGNSHRQSTVRCALFGHRWDDFGGDRFLCTRIGCHHERPSTAGSAS